MNEQVKNILKKIDELEQKLKDELQKDDKPFIDFELIGKKICFRKDIIKEQQKELKNVWRYLKEAPLAFILTAPFIYMLIVPAIILDIFVAIYQTINFPIYKIPKVKRSDYIVFDRGYLAYLNTIEKINCLYCSYFNGLMAYVSEVAARTEQYWCPIKHAKKIAYRHSRYNHFLSYGDAKAFREELEKLREELQNLS